VLLAVLDGGIDELGVLLLLGRGEDQGGVGGGILGVVLVDGREITRVADDDLPKRLATFLWASRSDAGSDGSGGEGRWGQLTVPEAFN
jgi:hypothetical protein